MKKELEQRKNKEAAKPASKPAGKPGQINQAVSQAGKNKQAKNKANVKPKTTTNKPALVGAAVPVAKATSTESKNETNSKFEKDPLGHQVGVSSSMRFLYLTPFFFFQN